MSEDFVERVFDSFSRAQESCVSSIAGTGLGMDIAKHLVKLMGGSISCRSMLGAGTSFTVRLSLRLAWQAERRAVDAFARHEAGYFDLILMDIQMPVLDGYGATALIRSMDRADSSIPIFAMTANTFDEDVLRVRESGMNGHLGKPYSAQELYRLLLQAFSVQG